ncbi:hypothetical protein QBK99_11035 [Corticibacterium sp. UT-5YL-CI-8]|nr:hypothetical protein [Tianweitania sp. UT-5YL-CI-8]
MTPAELIQDLDAALARTGENCILRRKEGATPVDKDVPIRASVRGLRPEEIVGTATHAFSKVVFSMTQILANGWPSGHVVTPGAVDPRLPRPNDWIVVKGKQRQVSFVNPIAVDGIVVRIEATVAG